MRVLIAPDKFKGSLSALAAAQAIERGMRRVFPGLVADLAPIADGGEGFAEALVATLGGEWITVASEDANGRPIQARYGWSEAQKIAVIEMSEASGLWRIKPEDRQPLLANTFGTGLLVRDAIQRGAKKILVGLGGSATTDGGTGVARALGYQFLNDVDSEFRVLPGTMDLLHRIKRPADLVLPEVIAACDVQNPLLGERGTAHVYAAQKGADAREIELLETAMFRLAEVCGATLRRDFRDVPGAGAAGGLGFGLLTFCDARIEPGFDIVASTIGLTERVSGADVVITGEGRLDDQTLDGKGPAGVAALARRAGKPVIAFAGAATQMAERSGVFDCAISIVDRPLPLESAIAEAADLLERAAARCAALLKIGAAL
jgi:glycerate 2-kinase